MIPAACAAVPHDDAPLWQDFPNVHRLVLRLHARGSMFVLVIRYRSVVDPFRRPRLRPSNAELARSGC